MTPRRTPSEEQVRDAFGEVGDALQRALVLSSDRVQSVLEDAVLRGRMTRRDAEELATSLVSLGREQAMELRTALARSVGDTVATASEAVANAGEAVATAAGDAVASAHGAVATAVPPLGKTRRRARRSGESANGSHVNGSANGSTNGHTSGSTNGRTNGSSNGHTNGTASGHLNGGSNGHATTIPAPPERLARRATTSQVPDDPGTQTAKALVDLTSTLTTSELWTLRELEAAGKARATVIKAIDRKLDR